MRESKITFELIVEYKKLCDKFAAGPMKMSFTDSARLTELDATLAMYDTTQFLIDECLKLRAQKEKLTEQRNWYARTLDGNDYVPKLDDQELETE